MFDLYMRGVGERSAFSLQRARRAKRQTGSKGFGRRAEVEALEQRTLLSVTIINGGGAGYVGRGGGGPPDVTGAAGPSSYLEINNTTVTLFSPKAGGAVLATRGINDFFYNSAAGNQTVIYSQNVNIAASPTGATESGTTVTITTTSPHGFVTGQKVTVAGVGVAGYNGGGLKITGTPTATSFTYTAGAGLANSGGGNVTASSCGTCDSTGVFDNLMGASGRFVIGEIDIESSQNVSQYLFAVSKSSNPTTFTPADWNFYNITTTEGSGGPSSTSWSDYPGNPGYNADSFVETFNMFGGGPNGCQVVTVKASDLAAGNPLVTSGAGQNVFKSDVSGGAQNYRATAMQDSAPGDPMWLIHNPDTGNSIDVEKMTGVLSTSPSFANTSISLPGSANFLGSGGVGDPLNPDNTAAIDGDDGDEGDDGGDDGGDPENPGGGGAFDPGTRILNASEFNNTIVAAHTVAVAAGNNTLASAQPNDKNGNPLGGSGYAVNDILTVNGGTFSTAAQLKVLTVNGSGSVTSVSVSNAGSYSSLSGVNGTVSGGAGSGASFSLFFNGELAAQWYAIDVSGTPAFQQVGGNPNVGRAAFGANTYSFEPGVAINSAGEIGLGFMESDTIGGAVNAATGGFISTFVTARKPTDPAGTMQPVLLVSAGTGTANINGRVGDFSGMNVDPSNGTFWHVNEFGSAVAGPTVIANFTPEDKPVLTAANDQTAVEGASQAFDLGKFVDADGSPWTIRVNWGDGTADTVFTTSSSGGIGTKPHTYAEEGPYIVRVTVTDNTTLSDSKTFNVSVSDPSVIGTGGFIVSDVEGADSGSQVVATFKDPGGPEVLGDYSAIIDWGDGTPTTVGDISLSGIVFSVKGHHTYAEESAADHPGSLPYLITVTLSHESSTDVVVVSESFVSDPAVTPTGGFTFTAVEGVPSATQTVATFTDPGGSEPLGDYSALIDWGDATPPSAGTITFAAGVYTVTGAHTYAVGLGLPGDFGNTFCGAVPPFYHKPITVTIKHEAAPLAVAVSDAVISLPPASAHLAGGSLIVVGTVGDDKVLINPVGNTGAVNVKLGSVSLGSFTLGIGGRIIVAAIAGDDDIQIAGGVRLDTVLYGGPGDDRIKGGAGRNIQVGCEGDDQLNGGSAGDLLIGGDGADRIVAGAGNDVLIGGELLDSALNEDDQYNDLVAVLNAGHIIPPFSASNDGAVDKMTGSSAFNIFYGHFTGAGALDIVTGKKGTIFDF